MTKPKTDTRHADQQLRKHRDPKTQRGLDPHEDLELETPSKEPKDGRSRQEAMRPKATQADGGPNPEGSPSSPFQAEDVMSGTQGKSKESRNDQ
ncbi:hypothetical protein L1889_06700 [Paenalcaligenes niemegkensis]|uniref:hypothetical protein n=1 Tax=Paenalcaligenes niemegkensis TaxID=2895469 RepID=UPI001EE88FC9|nr:hypothetical protein [Paenalcaligenes niemegkensis]MCQ9616435.1 hypothetical protein [Paenalcaligenes niemegkensis]